MSNSCRFQLLKCCFHFSSMIMTSLTFGLLVGKRKLLEHATSGSVKLYCSFVTITLHSTTRSIVKTFSSLVAGSLTAQQCSHARSSQQNKNTNYFGVTISKLWTQKKNQKMFYCFSWIITSKLVFQGTINCYVWQLSILKMLIRAPECDYFGRTRSHKPVRCYYPFSLVKQKHALHFYSC